MSNSVSENLFEAVNLLIDKKLSEVTFDTTLICEVIETNLVNKSEHIVKNNSMTFKAYSLNEETYFKGSKVYVTIPQGNYNLKKIILGEAKTDTLSAKSMRPLDSLLPLRSNNWLTSDTAAKINEGQIVTITIENINTNLEIPKQFGIKAIFDSWIPTAIKGNYGLNIEVTDETGRQNLNTRFDSTEFYGNPYMYDDGFTVEKLFVLPSWAKKITFSKYINTFYDENNQEIELDGIDKYINLTDIVLQIGLDSSINENKNAPIIDLFLNDNQSLFYSSIETRIVRNINLILADANNSYLTTEDIEISPYEVRWFEYVPGYGVDLEAAGSNWKELVDNKNKIFYECEILPERANYQIKVLVLQDGKLVTEKGLIFSNENETLSDIQAMSQNNLIITINGSKTHSGIFNVYNSKRKYIGETTNQTFQIGVTFGDLKTIDPDTDTITWSLPSDTSLLTFSKVEGNVISLSAHINEYFEASDQYTTIRCFVEKDGVTYHAEKLLSFGYKETQGTNYSVNLIPKDGNGNIIRNIVSTKQPNIYIHAEVRDSYGNPLTDKGEWSWKFSDNNIMDFSNINNSNQVLVKLKEGYDIISEENYSIIQYSIQTTLENGLKVTLAAELPIIIVAPEYENYYIDGATSVLISPMGGYDYTSSPYKFFKPDGMVQDNVEYSFAQQGDYFKTTSSNQLQINNSIKSTYPIALKVQIDGIGTVWRQPILIQNDSYQSDILNQWNGNLEIGDEDHNYIMSSIIGAGFKDAENKFTGVFMGTVGKQFNNAVTGLYGFNAGEKTFSLDAETGNAFFKGDIYANSLILGANAYVDGTVYAKKGKIGNWLLNGDFIQSGNNPVSKGTSGIILNASSGSPSDSSLIVRKQNGDTKGSNGMYPYEDIVFLSATNSSIAGWQMDSFRMYNANDKWGTGLSTTNSDGDPAFWAGYVGKGLTPWNADADRGWAIDTKFYVTNTGFLKATNAEIEGKITANKGGNIGGWIIDAGQDYIKSGDSSIWLNGDGKGSYNGDSDVGKMIGLNSDDFTRNNAVLRLGSSPSTAKFILTNDGKIYATAGTIASLKLENNALYTSYQKGIERIDDKNNSTFRTDKQGGFGNEGLFQYWYDFKGNKLAAQTKFTISIERLIDFIYQVEDELWGTSAGSDYIRIETIK